MLTFEQISELIDLVAKNRLAGVEIERSGFRLKIEGRSATAAVAPAAVPDATPLEVAAPSPEQEAPEETAPKHDHVLNSPIVGTFYRSPNPDSAPFVEVGDRVKKGQVLCIVEAMKLMNEIESDADGVVVEIFPKNAQPVEFGEALFGIKTS